MVRKDVQRYRRAAKNGRAAEKLAMWARIIAAMLTLAKEGDWAGSSADLLAWLRPRVQGPLPVAGELTKQLRYLARPLRRDGLEITISKGTARRIEVKAVEQSE